MKNENASSERETAENWKPSHVGLSDLLGDCGSLCWEWTTNTICFLAVLGWHVGVIESSELSELYDIVFGR